MKFIEGNDALRARKCFEEIQTTLSRYDCILIPDLQIIAGQVRHGIKIVAKDRTKITEGKNITNDQGIRLG